MDVSQMKPSDLVPISRTVEFITDESGQPRIFTHEDDDRLPHDIYQVRLLVRFTAMRMPIYGPPADVRLNARRSTVAPIIYDAPGDTVGVAIPMPPAMTPGLAKLESDLRRQAEQAALSLYFQKYKLRDNLNEFRQYFNLKPIPANR